MDDLTGNRYGRLTVMYPVRDDKGNLKWHCKCDCGNERDIRRQSLVRGLTKSCGCYGRDVKRDMHLTHGQTGTKLYNVWSGMKSRCNYEKHIDNKWYRDKNIKVCSEWEDSFEAFRDWAMASGYKEGLTIDRINNDLGYSPENCRWATPKEQACNRSTNLNYTYNGKTQCLKRWAEELGIKYHTLYCRIKSGHSFLDAINM